MSPRFTAVLAAFEGTAGVARGRMFGAEGLKFGGKVFAMEVKGRLVVKLPAVRVEELVSAGAARFDPGHGRTMREWAAIDPESPLDWVALAGESLRWAGSK